jgi:hypothetical protein
MKGKIHPITGHENTEGESRYSCPLSSVFTLNWGGWSVPCPDYFASGIETQYLLYRSLGGPQGWYEWVRNISPPPEFSLWAM